MAKKKTDVEPPQSGPGAPRLPAPPTPLGLVGLNIVRIRKAQGLSSKELAASLGLSLGYLVKIEGGRADPKLSTIFTIANNLGVPFEEFLVPQRGE
jgi:transcriptional regulator with XRE-family HTH domain